MFIGAGNYELMLSTEHTYTTVLDAAGNGTSTSIQNHIHKIVTGTVEVINDHTHELKLIGADPKFNLT